MRAVAAVNSRTGTALVDIRCGVPYRKGVCGKHLGGAWRTSKGTIVIVNRLKDGEMSWYRSVSQSAERREAIWHEEGFVPEIPIMLRVDREWHDVPGEDEDALVRCPRGHGRWPVDRALLKKKIEEAVATRRAATFMSRPTR
jgi:hypothetical protein